MSLKIRCSYCDEGYFDDIETGSILSDNTTLRIANKVKCDHCNGIGVCQIKCDECKINFEVDEN